MITFGIKEDPPLVALQGGYSTLSQTRAPERAIPSRATIYTPGGRASTAPITGSPFYETKEAAPLRPASFERFAGTCGVLAGVTGFLYAVSFSTGWVVIRYSLSVVDVALGSTAYVRPEAARRLQYSESPFSPEVITLSWLWR
jgi:hypothetical protein